MITQKKSIFIVGIKGVAMASLALILKKIGHKITGSDVEEDFITDLELKENNIEIKTGFVKEVINDSIDMVIYSAAHGGIKNPQVQEAQKRGKTVLHQAQVLGQISKLFRETVAVAGSHGKTTTSSMLSYALINLAEKPSYMVGTPRFNTFWGGDFQKGDNFVVEADEYGVSPPFDLTPKFNFLDPKTIICTNIDYDHPDVYKNIVEVENAFKNFISGKKIYYCADEARLLRLIDQSQQSRKISFGYTDNADFQIKNPITDEAGSRFDIFQNGKPFGNFSISLYGDKNISNATAVISVLVNWGFPKDSIAKSIKNFTGAARRFEQIFENNGTYLFDDYAHHPKEIETTIKAARARFPNNRIIIVFQPHTYSRTLALLSDFTASLSLADRSYILPIFSSARENPSDFNVTSSDIVKSNPDKLIGAESKDKLIQNLASGLKSHDVVLTMGAGDVYKLKDEIIDIIKSL